MTETPLYRPITAGEFLHERKMRFSPDSLEATGIPFDAISHGRTEPLTPPTPSPDWQSRLGSISQVMPLDFEGYAAILLPWVAYREQIRYDVEGIAEAYRSFGLTVPEERSLDRIYADFGVIERSREVPALARMVLDRFAGTAKTVFVRSASYAPDEPTYWAIERKLFLELEDRFVRYLTLEVFTPCFQPAAAGISITRGIHRFSTSPEAQTLLHPSYRSSRIALCHYS